MHRRSHDGSGKEVVASEDFLRRSFKVAQQAEFKTHEPPYMCCCSLAGKATVQALTGWSGKLSFQAQRQKQYTPERTLLLNGSSNSNKF